MLLSRFNGNTLNGDRPKVQPLMGARPCLCMYTDRNRLYTPNGNVHLIKFFFLPPVAAIRNTFSSSLSHFRIGFIALHCKWMDDGGYNGREDARGRAVFLRI